ncbi:25S rRNA (uracil2634-N3)-methyltransferase [Aspergillus foveolatus]|uniref:25S rRNA (uracil2634-N3)-methyltransferase n=1 Tax=Aspergillus foveolatus TaxID=210207 RepID=UPI003CCD0607
MARLKRARALHQHQNVHSGLNTSHGTGRKHRKMSSFAKLSTKNNYKNSVIKENNEENNAPARKNEKHQQKQHTRPIVPFRRKDRILLVGDGDFSFAHSLATYHRCKNLLATCYDSQETLFAKYPQAEKKIAEIISLKTKNQLKSDGKDNDTANPQSQIGPKVLFSVDAKKLGSATGGGRDVRIGFSRQERKEPAWKKHDGNKRSTRSAKVTEDTASNKGKGTGMEKGGPWDMICFNFPHVGGLSTDVNRQVRANQELLVAFFKACVPLLAERPEELGDDAEVDDDWEFETDVEDEFEESDGEYDEENGAVKAKDERRTEPGQVLVTLFEGEPYTLWNIRDLARHAGLRVVTSFKFPWACYRGYSHARTLGEIAGKDGARGGWRGEDREARMYVFEVKTEDHPQLGVTGKRKKRSTDMDESDSD